MEISEATAAAVSASENPVSAPIVGWKPTDASIMIHSSSSVPAPDNQLGERFHQREDEYPVGYRFKPHDQELIIHYLQGKVLNRPLPPNPIHDVELYKYDPEVLTARYEPCGDEEWYFFTPRDKKYPNGKRPTRAVGEYGYWKATGADKDVFTEDETVGNKKLPGKKVGTKKTLVFYRGGAQNGTKTNWIMHEYRADKSPRISGGENNMRLDAWVLCRIRNKKNCRTQDDDINMDLSLEENEILEPHGGGRGSSSGVASGNHVHFPNVTGNGSESEYLDHRCNSAYHLMNISENGPLQAMQRVSQDHALADIPVDLPLDQQNNSNYFQWETIHDYGMGSSPDLDDELNIHLSTPLPEDLNHIFNSSNSSQAGKFM